MLITTAFVPNQDRRFFPAVRQRSVLCRAVCIRNLTLRATQITLGVKYVLDRSSGRTASKKVWMLSLY